MKNTKVSKLVISMLITSFAMPTVADARIKGRRRSADSGVSRNRAAGTTTSNTKGVETVNAVAVKNDAAKPQEMIISKEEYKLPENKLKYLNTLKANVFQAKQKAVEQCEGISGAISKIYGLSTASAVSSGLGTAAAGTALVSGIIKSNKQNVAYAIQDNGITKDKEKVLMENLTKEQKDLLKERKEYIKGLEEHQNAKYDEGNKLQREEGETDDAFEKRKQKIYDEGDFYAKHITEGKKLLADDREKMGLPREEDSSVVNMNQKQIDENLKTATTMGHVRTGMMAGATATSVISMGTSIGATVDAGKLDERMTSCNNAIADLKKANGILYAEIKNTEEVLQQKLGDEYEEKKPEYMKQAENMNKTVSGIVGSCKKFETKDIKYVKNLMTASSVVSGIGSATALTGAITSGLANTEKAKGDRNYEKKLDITANVMAGITTGTSLTSTGLSSAAAVATGKKLQQQAKDCENALATDLLVDVSKEVNAIEKGQQERDDERRANIEKLRKEGKI